MTEKETNIERAADMGAMNLEETENQYTGVNAMAIQEISMNKIKLSRNSRMAISPGDLSELMASIKEQGLLQPVGVMKNDKGGFELCYGNRRFLAMSKLGKSKIPAVIFEKKSDADIDLKNLTENIQRRNLSLAEAGRYMSLLMAGGLSVKEIAARLGMAAGYVENCLKSYHHVPAEFRDDLEVRNGNSKPTPGKIAIKTANEIINAKNHYNLKSDQVKKLFREAKSNPDFQVENVKRYAAAVLSGKRDIIKSATQVRHVNLQFTIPENHAADLEKQFVDDGPYRSLRGLFLDVLSGKRATRIKVHGT